MAERRVSYWKVAPEGTRLLQELTAYTKASGVEPTLLELVKIRASQINGCAYCIDMHTQDARAEGETEQRIYLLNAWHEAPFYSERERAALALTEVMTRIADGGVPDEVYEAARAVFSEKEIADLAYAIVTINAFNRLSIMSRMPAGIYRRREQKAP
jgi:AhpD family alkylhydroperoxidase